MVSCWCRFGAASELGMDVSYRKWAYEGGELMSTTISSTSSDRPRARMISISATTRISPSSGDGNECEGWAVAMSSVGSVSSIGARAEFLTLC